MKAEEAIKYLKTTCGKNRISLRIPDKQANEIADLIEQQQKVIEAAKEVFECGLLADDYKETCEICNMKKQSIKQCKNNCPIGKLKEALIHAN